MNEDHPELPEIDHVITAYLVAVEQGKLPDQETIIASHPHIATELQAFFDTDAQFRRNVTSPAINGWYLTSSTISQLPQLLGNYELEKKIARGGMGVVYKARHLQRNHTVALKMLLVGRLASADEIKRFCTESEAAAKLDHPGIVRIQEVSEEDGVHFYTMDFIDGESLADRLQRGPLPCKEAATIIYKAACAVAYAHEHRILHRDLKPANILINQANEPTITDFGLAKSLDTDRQLTATGEILGTLQFMAPEQAAAKHDTIAEPTDIYALGAILFTCLTGQPVFTASSHIDLLLQVLKSEPESPRRIAPDVPSKLEAICLRCLEKDPAQRYTSAGELVDDLEHFLSDEPIDTTSVHLRNRARRWVRHNSLLVAHVGALLIVELFRQTKYIVREETDWAFEPQFSVSLWLGS